MQVRIGEYIDVQMGQRRFQEWLEEEGLAGSQDLLRLYLDVKSYSRLLEDVNVSVHGTVS